MGKFLPSGFAICHFLFAISSSPAQVQESAPELAPRILIDRGLAQRPVRLVSVSADSIEVVDAAGRTQPIPRNQILAIIPPFADLDPPVVEERVPGAKPPETEKTRPFGRLELIDGQSIPGALEVTATDAQQEPAPKAAQGKDESLTWNSKLFGVFTLPLESISTLILAPDKADISGPPPAEDTVILSNGDRSEGFIASIGASIHIEKGGKVADVPTSRVAGVHLANALKPARGPWIWLSDATAVAASMLAIDSAGRATVAANIPGAAAQPTAIIDANDIRAICFDMSALRPLAACTAAITPSPSRRWTQPLKIADTRGVPLGATDIELPGPMTVEWTLPLGATRLGMTIELPPSARVWGDCDVSVESISDRRTAPLAKERLNSAHAVADINVALTGAAKVRLTLAPANNSPIQDRVVLRRPIVLVK
jgi:hypothetical protein